MPLDILVFRHFAIYPKKDTKNFINSISYGQLTLMKCISQLNFFVLQEFLMILFGPKPIIRHFSIPRIVCRIVAAMLLPSNL